MSSPGLIINMGRAPPTAPKEISLPQHQCLLLPQCADMWVAARLAGSLPS